MKTFSMTMISVMAMSGFALAQGTTAGSAAGGAKAGVGATTTTTTTTKTGAGTGTATGAAKTGTGAAGTAAGGVAAGAKMEMPKPAAEIAAHAKAFGGTVRCTGMGMGGADMKTEMKFTGTMKAKVDLDGWWIRHTMDGKMGEGKAVMKFKLEMFSTYEANSKKWRILGVTNDGGAMMGTSDGPKEGKMTVMYDTYGAWGQGMMREVHDASDKKAGVKMTGEMSMDKGKTWGKVYEMTCKK